MSTEPSTIGRWFDEIQQAISKLQYLNYGEEDICITMPDYVKGILTSYNRQMYAPQQTEFNKLYGCRVQSGYENAIIVHHETNSHHPEHWIMTKITI